MNGLISASIIVGLVMHAVSICALVWAASRFVTEMRVGIKDLLAGQERTRADLASHTHREEARFDEIRQRFHAFGNELGETHERLARLDERVDNLRGR